jgi:hypothetical protein
MPPYRDYDYRRAGYYSQIIYPSDSRIDDSCIGSVTTPVFLHEQTQKPSANSVEWTVLSLLSGFKTLLCFRQNLEAAQKLQQLILHKTFCPTLQHLEDNLQVSGRAKVLGQGFGLAYS